MTIYYRFVDKLIALIPDVCKSSFKFDESFEYGAKMDRILDGLDIKPAEEDDEQVD